MTRVTFRSFAFGLAACAAAMTVSMTAPRAAEPLRTGVDATFAPHAMVKLGGGLQGFNIDLGEELAKRMGRKIEIEGTEFRSEEHTSELQSLMRISSAVFCMKKKSAE